MFLRRITDKKGSDYEYSLKDVEKVLSSPVLRVVDFYEEETLNFNLLKGLLVNQENPKYQKYLSALIKQMKDNKDTEFISKFYDSTQFDKTFIIKLNEQWTDFFSYIAVNKILPLKQIRGFSLDSLCLLDENKIQDINVEGCLTDYISNQSDYLNIQNPDVAKIISQFCILGVKLKKIEIDTANKDLIVGVYENNLYELTFENRVAKSRIANIIDNSTIVLDDNLLSKLLTMSKCSMDDKIQLWAKALPNLTEETCKKHFDEIGFPELKGIFTKRNNYTKTYEDNSFIRDILYVLKKNTWIFDYYKKSDDEGYVVVKNPIKDKRY